jgi:hypothetical protein
MRAQVQHNPRAATLGLLDRALIGAAFLLVLILLGVQMVRAAEVMQAVPASTVHHSSSSYPMISGTVFTVNESP